MISPEASQLNLPLYSPFLLIKEEKSEHNVKIGKIEEKEEARIAFCMQSIMSSVMQCLNCFVLCKTFCTFIWADLIF